MRYFKIAIAALKYPALRGAAMPPAQPLACIAAEGGIANNCVVCNSRQYIAKFFILYHIKQKKSSGCHLGCELYNEKTADNGVTRYNLVYNGDK